MVQIRQERKREIVAAASKIFRAKGLHAAGMRDIAAELGMAVGNLYYYFQDKEDLLAYVQDSTLTGLLALAGRVKALDAPVDWKLFLQTAGHVVLLNEGTPGSLAHLEVEALSDKYRRPIQERRDAYERSFRALIEDGVKDRVFRPVDEKVTALAILGAVNWTVKWFRPGGPKSARDIGRETAELLVRGLLAPGTEMNAPPLEALLPLIETPETPEMPETIET